jgi:hypothetical protein
MSTVCEKDFALHIGSSPSLVAYWKFDEAVGPPFVSEVSPTLNNFVFSAVATPDGGAPGIINNAIRFTGMPPGTGESLITADFDPAIIIANGFTWTTWINFTTFGTSNDSDIGRVVFYDALDNPVISLRAVLPGGSPPRFITVFKNIVFSVFTPTAAFGVGVWNFVGMRFDPNSLKVGIRRGHPTFGLGGWEESPPLADNLSGIVKGRISVQAGLNALGTSQDYVQDESGFWARLLTDQEMLALFNGGSPPSYPNIPQ